MANIRKSLKYPTSMTVVAVGVTAILLAALLELLLTESMVAGILGLWGIIIGSIGVIAVAIIWLLGRLD